MAAYKETPTPNSRQLATIENLHYRPSIGAQKY